jgi:FG-GAP-like repeat
VYRISSRVAFCLTWLWASVAVAQSPAIGNCRVFPADNIWNTPVDQLPVAANSATFVGTIGAALPVHADFGSGTYNGGPIGIPFITVPGTQTKFPAAFQYAAESDPGPYAVPLDAPIEGGSQSQGDRHAISVDVDNCVLYELYNAFPQASSWQAGSGAIYSLGSNALRPSTWTSADAAGLPIFPGLARYDEVAAGEIRHALRFTVPRTQHAFVWPARHYASNLTDPKYPPMGVRFRLRSNYDLSGFSTANQVILRALKKYGMMIADNGSAWYISGAPDPRWDNSDLHNLGRIMGADFEVVDVSGLLVDPNSGQTRQAQIPAAFARDFRGIGRSDVLLYDPTSGTAYTGLSNADGTFQYSSALFTPAFDTVRTGDFNGDGKADIVVYNSRTGLAYLGMGNGDGTFAFQSLFWSPGYDFVAAGDLNGDGKTDFALYNSATGTMYTAIGNGTGGFIYRYTLISPGYTFVRLADFAGTGKAGIFLYNAEDGTAFLGAGDGSGSFAFNFLAVSSGYDLADIGDLNGDGKADLILYNSMNGNAASAISDGSGGFAFMPLLFSPGFTSVRLADHSGDGKADLTVYNRTNAAAYFGTGTGTGTFNFQSLFWSRGYTTVEPQDVNGDGKADIVLYNNATGTEYTGISAGNGNFSYTYQYWGAGRTLAK